MPRAKKNTEPNSLPKVKTVNGNTAETQITETLTSAINNETYETEVTETQANKIPNSEAQISENQTSSLAEQSEKSFSHRSHSLKRLIYIFNEKGGVGKTTFARGLLNLYHKYNISCLVFDADDRAPQLHRFFNNKIGKEVKKINVFKIGNYDDLLNDLEKDTNVILVDLPGTVGAAFEEMQKELGLFGQAKKLGYQITIVVVMSRTKDCLAALEQLMKYCDGQNQQVDWVVVFNEFFGERSKFTRWDKNAQLKESFFQHKGIEVTMPDLYEELYDLIDEKNLTFSEAAECQELTLSNRSRAFRWLNQFEQNAQVASVYLGLDLAKSPDNIPTAISSGDGKAIATESTLPELTTSHPAPQANAETLAQSELETSI